MTAPVYNDGDFYIDTSNQDFWLRESGAWVRKGNVRDDLTPAQDAAIDLAVALTTKV
jgi:hypothetical protein